MEKEFSLLDKEIINLLKNSSSVDDLLRKREFIIRYLFLHNKFLDIFYNDVPVKSNLEYEIDAINYIKDLINRVVRSELCIGVVPCSCCNNYYLCKANHFSKDMSKDYKFLGVVGVGQNE